MVGFDFYTHEYLGSAIPEKAFSGVAARAEAVLARFKRIYRVESDGEMAIWFAENDSQRQLNAEVSEAA